MVFVVAGMHRSGTSMVTRLLNLCGVYLGEEKDLIPIAEDNLEGFWEHTGFQAINEEILALFNGSWDSPPLLEAGWETHPHLFSSIRPRVNNLINEFLPHRKWGWKDPRNSLTLPFWKTLLPDLKVIICLRNPYDVYKSLSRRGYASSIFSNNLWLLYYQSLLATTDLGNRIITHFESYFSNPELELRRLVNYLEMDVSDAKIKMACNTISPNLRHSHASTSDILSINPPVDLLKIYTDLCYQAGSVFEASLQSEDLKSLNSVVSNNEVMSSNSLAVILKFELERKDQELERKDQELERKDQELERKDQELERKDQELEQRNQIIEQKNANIQRLSNQKNYLQNELQRIFKSRSWRLIRFLQKINAPVSKGIRFSGNILANFYKLFSIRQQESIRGINSHLQQRVNVTTSADPSEQILVDAYNNLLLNSTGQITDEFVPLAKDEVLSSESPVKFIAFYLPQFHPIPENDEWWGKGFTEWSNVSKAIPQFVGHYQPHLPGELGFYDLRTPGTQKRQIELARMYGIHGFAFYYYWFNGKRLLEKPLDLFLESGEDFPFCICWANENWTRRWDGREDEILIGQSHSPESDLRFIQDVEPIFQDKRYIRVNGRPLLIIYRANILPDVLRTVELWRKYCKSRGINDPYLVAAQTFGFMDPREVGFDAAVEFPPHNVATKNIRHLVKVTNRHYRGNIVDYKEIVEKTSSLVQPDYQLFKTVFPSWDNEARKPGKGYTFAFSTPNLYKEWLLQASKFTMQEHDPEKRLLFINAWNEWAEGAHLEPDRKYGYAYLEATADVLREILKMKGSITDSRYGENNNSLKSRQFENQEQDSNLISLHPIIIFQPGKVGSTSVHISLEKAYNDLGISTQIYHSHFLIDIDKRLEFISTVRSNPTNSIKKLLESKKLKNQIDTHPEKTWNVISLVRDPVAQKVSALFQLIDEYFPGWQEKFKSNSLSLADMKKTLLEKGEFDAGKTDSWFDNQLQPFCGLDVFSIPFDKNKGFQIYRPNPRINLMVIRLEDLNRVAKQAFYEFLGTKKFSIISTNVSEEKPYYDLYKQFKNLPIPSVYLENAYNTRYARHFYTDDEIHSFYVRWQNLQREDQE